MNSTKEAQGRTTWVDAARGIGIILVVAAHMERGLIESRLLPADPIYLVADKIIYAFHMPLFFFISGIYLTSALTSGRTKFFKDKFKTIIWPYFLWSLIYVTAVMITGKNINNPLDLQDLADILWKPVGQFWFLYALFLCHLTMAMLWPKRTLLAIATLLGIILASGLSNGGILLLAMRALPFVLVGTLAGPWLLTHAHSIRRFAPALMIGAWLVLAVTVEMNNRGLNDGHFQPFIHYIAASAGICGTLMIAMIIGGQAPWLCRIGKMSMAIFVAHTFFSAGLRIAVQRSGVHIDPILLLIAGSIAGIGGPWLLYQWAGKRRMTALLGLGKYVRA